MAAAVGDVFRFALVQELFSQQVINTFAAQILVVPAGTTEAAWVATWFADATGYFNAAGGIRDFLRDIQTADVLHLKWQVQRVTPNPTQVFDVPIITSAAGAMAGNCETANVGVCVTRRGSQAGRRQKGRIAFAGGAQASQANGRWAAGYLTNVDAVGSSAIGVQTVAGGLNSVQMGYWVPAHTSIVNGVPVSYAALFVGCVSRTSRDTIRVQRSRTVGVGR